MNKKVLIGVGGFLLLAVGAIIYASTQSDILTSPKKNVTNVPGGPPAAATQTTENNAGAGVYTEYNTGATYVTDNQRVLFFHAPWCSQCRSIEAGIKSQGVPDGYVILKVDYDSNQDLRKKYGVTLQTTFVKIDDKGNLISKYVAYDEPTFEAVKKNFL